MQLVCPRSSRGRPLRPGARRLVGKGQEPCQGRWATNPLADLRPRMGADKTIRRMWRQREGEGMYSVEVRRGRVALRVVMARDRGVRMG